MRKILVIKLGALGDFVIATGPFKAIKEKEAEAHITLLTTAAFVNMAKQSGFFDEIIVDKRLPFYNLGYLWKLHKKLQGFDFVYDLQTNQRTGYYYLLAGKPQWSGMAKGCSHFDDNPERKNLHVVKSSEEQLKKCGINHIPNPNITFAKADCSKTLEEHKVKENNFVALIPGGAAHREDKRWPFYTELATKFMQQGKQVVLVGGKAESALLAEISSQSGAVNLCGQTNLHQLIDLLDKAQIVVGNDTGPTHMAAATNTKGVVLFGSGSNYKQSKPVSDYFTVIHKDNISDITVDEVLEVFK